MPQIPCERVRFNKGQKMTITTHEPHGFKKGDIIFALEQRMWIVDIPTETTLVIREWRWFDWLSWALWSHYKDFPFASFVLDMWLVIVLVYIYYNFS